MQWYIIGGILFILSFSLLFYVYKDVKTLMNGKKKYSDTRLIFFFLISFLLVLLSLVSLIYAAYLATKDDNVGVESTIYFAVASYLLTIGFAAIIYYSQAIENKSFLDKLENQISKKLDIMTKEDLKEIFNFAINNSIKEMRLEDLKDEIKKELLNEMKKEIGKI
ncbi:hypothetical protein M3649_13430 [Ureibacillus chungkukjangi]|uniref:hypothetical protein n=1 Tax=Ureibacillus chungkukjangi TaxID=1202712 RepID=UPI00203AE322|nr:hypothetical protein [Ureibacillus chungkukjangi]MCM3389138.1 hypothetical protein [Ureibacillus chungkukjangi]